MISHRSGGSCSQGCPRRLVSDRGHRQSRLIKSLQLQNLLQCPASPLLKVCSSSGPIAWDHKVAAVDICGTNDCPVDTLLSECCFRLELQLAVAVDGRRTITLRVELPEGLGPIEDPIYRHEDKKRTSGFAGPCYVDCACYVDRAGLRVLSFASDKI